ncbi:hypothetical protein [Stenotrophomonas sp. ATs4]|uniref:hypothetical protein n=1 Tax=Stenotrophomonas sp. ATs4 TaxID=3402766 RepID=UPI003F7236A5
MTAYELQRNANVLVLQEMRSRFTDAGSPSRTAALDAAISALSAHPSPGGQDALSAMLPDDARLVGVIADNIERGKLDHPGFYRNTQLAEALRRVLDAAQSCQRFPCSQWDDNDLLAALIGVENYLYYGDSNPIHTATVRAAINALAARQPVGEPVGEPVAEVSRETFSGDGTSDIIKPNLPIGTKLYAAPTAQAVDLGQSFQAGVSEWMDKCFLPSLYSNMTERGDRLLEEVLELLQAHGYDSARVPTLVNYVFGRPVGEPAQEVGGVMVTLAAYCSVAGLSMQADGQAELDRINQADVIARIRAKQEAKNALHFDTPLPGNAAAPAQLVGPGQMPHGIRLVEIPRRNGLDPINVFVQDYELGRGRIVVTCYGQAWCGFWGAMGDRTVMQFVAACDADYVAGNMLSGRHEHVKKHERTYVERIATEVIAEFRALIDGKAVGNG